LRVLVIGILPATTTTSVQLYTSALRMEAVMCLRNLCRHW